MFYNGYNYAPIIVSYGTKDDFTIVNQEMHDKFTSIVKSVEE